MSLALTAQMKVLTALVEGQQSAEEHTMPEPNRTVLARNTGCGEKRPGVECAGSLCLP